MAKTENCNGLPDVRDGLTDEERIVLHCLHEAEKELGERNVPTVMVYGRVTEHMNISEEAFQAILRKLIA